MSHSQKRTVRDLRTALGRAGQARATQDEEAMYGEWIWSLGGVRAYRRMTEDADGTPVGELTVVGPAGPVRYQVAGLDLRELT